MGFFGVDFFGFRCAAELFCEKKFPPKNIAPSRSLQVKWMFLHLAGPTYPDYSLIKTHV